MSVQTCHCFDDIRPSNSVPGGWVHVATGDPLCYPYHEPDTIAEPIATER